MTDTTLPRSFYQRSYDLLAQKLIKQPNNQRLFNQQLFYCEQLDWPKTCFPILNQVKSKFGISKRIVEKYVDYYIQHNNYSEIVQLLDTWGAKYDMEREMQKTLITSLVKINEFETADIELSEWMLARNNIEELEFSAEQYLLMKDTASLLLYLKKIHQKDPLNDLLNRHYGELLMLNGEWNEGIKLMSNYVFSGKADLPFAMNVANILHKNGFSSEGVAVLRRFQNLDEVKYKISAINEETRQWDSALFYVDKILVKTPTDKKALMRKGTIYENRGWLSYSLVFFNKMLVNYPKDSSIMNRVDIIHKKLSYLQSLQPETNTIR